jgi:hypothetical protein
MPGKQTMPAAYIIARNPARGGTTKQSLSKEPVSEIAAVAEFILSLVEGLPHNDGRKNPEIVWAMRRCNDVLWVDSPLFSIRPLPVG